MPRIVYSALVLSVGFLGLAFLSCFGYADPPGTPPRTQDPVLLFPLIFLPITWFAGRLWYSMPVFFGYGAFMMFPFGLLIFGPATHHGFIEPLPPFFTFSLLVFCCISGFITASVGRISSNTQHAKAK